MASYDNIIARLAQMPQWNSTYESAILEPYSYLATVPGKEVRTKLIEAFNVWLHVPPERLKIIADVVRMLQNASLLVDDVEDGSQLRRGVPVAHKIYGVPQTINTANYVYFLAFQQLFNLSQQLKAANGGSAPDLERIVNEELLNLHRGQGLDLLWRDSLQCPTEDEYILMVNNKTGGLLRIAIKLMMAQSDNHTDFVPLVNLVGILYQIRDDYMNLESDEYKDNKGFAEDLTEGKFSFPIVHSIRADRSNRQVLNVLQKRPTTPTTKRYVVDYMRNRTKSFVYARKVMHSLEAQARAEIARLGGNSMLEAIIDALHVEAEPEDDD